MRLIDADELIKDRVSNDPVVIAVKCAETVDPESVISQWISVKDRLPEKGIMVLTAIIGTDLIYVEERDRKEMRRTSIGFIDDDGYWCDCVGCSEIVTPSYWMTLPEPPMNDGKENTESAENKTTSFLINRFLKVN